MRTILRDRLKHHGNGAWFIAAGFPGFLAICAMALLTGCGRTHGPERVPISGQVFLDGKPLTGASGGSIVLVPAGNARLSVGTLDKEGRFVLTCNKPGDGTVRGRHQVAISPPEGRGENAVYRPIPRKYADPAASGIEVNIDAPTKSLRIDLRSDGSAPSVEKSGR